MRFYLCVFIYYALSFGLGVRLYFVLKHIVFRPLLVCRHSYRHDALCRCAAVPLCRPVSMLLRRMAVVLLMSYRHTVYLRIYNIIYIRHQADAHSPYYMHSEHTQKKTASPWTWGEYAAGKAIYLYLYRYSIQNVQAIRILWCVLCIIHAVCTHRFAEYLLSTYHHIQSTYKCYIFIFCIQIRSTFRHHHHHHHRHVMM